MMWMQLVGAATRAGGRPSDPQKHLLSSMSQENYRKEAQETEAGHGLANNCHRLCCCMILIWFAGAAARAGGRPPGPREHLLRQVDAAALLAGSALHSRTAAWQTAVRSSVAWCCQAWCPNRAFTVPAWRSGTRVMLLAPRSTSTSLVQPRTMDNLLMIRDPGLDFLSRGPPADLAARL